MVENIIPGLQDGWINYVNKTIEDLEDGRLVYLKGIQGTGKTSLSREMTRRHIEDNPSAKVVIIIPNHEFARREWEYAFPKDKFTHWLGRAQFDLDGSPMCPMREHSLIKPFFTRKCVNTFTCQVCQAKTGNVRKDGKIHTHFSEFIVESGLPEDYKCPHQEQFKVDTNVYFIVYQYLNTKAFEGLSPDWIISDDVLLTDTIEIPTKTELRILIGTYNMLIFDKEGVDPIEWEDFDEKHGPDLVKIMNREIHIQFGRFHRDIDSGEEIFENRMWNVLTQYNPQDILLHKRYEAVFGEREQFKIPYLHLLFDLAFTPSKVLMIRAMQDNAFLRMMVGNYARARKRMPEIISVELPNYTVSSEVRRVVGNRMGVLAWYPKKAFWGSNYPTTVKMLKPKIQYLVDTCNPRTIGIVSYQLVTEGRDGRSIYDFIPEDFPRHCVKVLHFNKLLGSNKLYDVDLCIRLGTYVHDLGATIREYNDLAFESLIPEMEIARVRKLVDGGYEFINPDLERYSRYRNAEQNTEGDMRFRIGTRDIKEYVFGKVFREIKEKFPTSNWKIVQDKDGKWVEKEYFDYNTIIDRAVMENGGVMSSTEIIRLLQDECDLSYEPAWNRMVRFVKMNSNVEQRSMIYNGRKRNCVVVL